MDKNDASLERHNIVLERFCATEIESKIQTTEIKILKNTIRDKNKLIATTLLTKQEENDKHISSYDNKMNIVDELSTSIKTLH